MCKQKEGIFSKSERKFDFISANLELDLGFLVQAEQREKGTLTCNNFVQREEGRGIGHGIILSKRIKGRKGVGLRINCPSKREKKSEVKQIRRGVRSPAR